MYKERPLAERLRQFIDEPRLAVRHRKSKVMPGACRNTIHHAEFIDATMRSWHEEETQRRAIYAFRTVKRKRGIP